MLKISAPVFVLAIMLSAAVMSAQTLAFASDEEPPAPSETPIEEPSETPTEEPTEEPTETPTEEPTEIPQDTCDFPKAQTMFGINLAFPLFPICTSTSLFSATEDPDEELNNCIATCNNDNTCSAMPSCFASCQAFRAQWLACNPPAEPTGSVPNEPKKALDSLFGILAATLFIALVLTISSRMENKK